MRTTVKLGLGAVAGAVGAGILALPVAAVADSSDVFYKRDDDRADVVMSVEDRDDDDTNDGTNNTNNTANTAGDTSGVDSNDATNSNVTAVSRDKDVSQDDLTRDWTRDGGDKTLDQTANQTNDRSRNDTRG